VSLTLYQLSYPTRIFNIKGVWRSKEEETVKHTLKKKKKKVGSIIAYLTSFLVLFLGICPHQGVIRAICNEESANKYMDKGHFQVSNCMSY
jgi:hypothetical protein